MIAWHKNDLNNRMYCNIPDGKKISMPRYYKNKIYEEYERIMVGKYQYDEMIKRQNQMIEQMGMDAYINLKQMKIDHSCTLVNINSKTRQKIFT